MILAVIIDGGSDGNSNESPKLGGREAFVRGGNMCDNVCVSESVVVDREDQCRQGTC